MWQNIKYDKNSYCCEHFLIDAYRHYKKTDLSDKLLNQSGFFNVQSLRKFKPLDKPHQHCIVMFRDKNRAHVGLWIDGKVLHLEPHGVTWQPIQHIKNKFNRVVFYEPI